MDQSVYTCLTVPESGPEAKPLSKYLLNNLHSEAYKDMGALIPSLCE